MMRRWKCSLTVRSGDGWTKKELVGGRDFGLHADAISRFTFQPLHTRFADLLRIAATVYAVDRTHRRNRRSVEDGRRRAFRIELDVDDPHFWRRPSTSALLGECLEFLSDDGWEFHFTCDPTTRPRRFQPRFPFLAASDKGAVICPYSGGLDSAAGLTRRLSARTSEEFVPVTVSHRNDLREAVTEQLRTLGRRFGKNLAPAIVTFAMRSPSKTGEEEPSQRTRPFLFLSVAGAVAAAMESSKIEIYESGVGAVNLPLQTGMTGSQVTRASHPHFVRLFAQLLSEVSQCPVDISLPFLRFTKGEVANSLRDNGLEDLARCTFSCVHYPLREKIRKQCGLCAACLFRRVALTAAGIEENVGTYKCDVLGPHANELTADKLKYLKAFLLQIDRLSQLETARNAPHFLLLHLRGTRVIEHDESPDLFVDLFRRYRREWLAFVAKGRARGLRWAELISQETAPVT